MVLLTALDSGVRTPDCGCFGAPTIDVLSQTLYCAMGERTIERAQRIAASMERHVIRHCLAILGVLSTSIPGAWAQTVERTARGPADKDIQIGLYVHVKSDCTAGPLPSIRLSSPPAHGKVAVKSAKIKATNYKQCLALEVPGFVAFYRSVPGFAGSDVLTLEIKFPNGRTEIQKITVSVGNGLPTQPI